MNTILISEYAQDSMQTHGHFVDHKGERYYKISHVDKMEPFFISLVSASDHWFYISSTGALSAGRIRPENALFPYRSVDVIHENADNTGSKTLVRVKKNETESVLWEPFNPHHDGLYQTERNLYKNGTGDKLVFEEINHTLGIKFEYSWSTSAQYGFVRQSELVNISQDDLEIDVLDGIQNLLPSGAPLGALQTKSALVDAYKWNQRLDELPMATFSLYAKLSDRAEPAEALRATTCVAVSAHTQDIYLSAKCLKAFRCQQKLLNTPLIRGERGAFFNRQTLMLKPQQSADWLMFADIDMNHSAIVKLANAVREQSDLGLDIKHDIKANQQALIKLMAGGDAWQLTSSEETDVHHYANVLFNSMRGGVFADGYQLDIEDVRRTFIATNRPIAEKHQHWFTRLPTDITHPQLVSLAKQTGDDQLVRLAYEYLPLSFGRRHGDPSRPWNHFEIKLSDEKGARLLTYQGNWRDIFQNWEALALSYPHYISSFIAKFVNASTIDGYNPYRITKQGVDWELLEPDDPWSNIGYWGDHQIIYLLKFLELASNYHSDELNQWLSDEYYAYANVPYEIDSVQQLFANPKDTVRFNQAKHQQTESLSHRVGSDGRLLQGADGCVYQVNLMEKLLVPLLSKLSNFVVDGGIWLNTQRPEWNDANNAIVGHGLSMVTLYYMRRYVAFLTQLVDHGKTSSFVLSNEVAQWMLETGRILTEASVRLAQEPITPQYRKSLLLSLATSAERYRNRVYLDGFSGKQSIDVASILQLLSATQTLLERTIVNNKRQDGLYNAYNILTLNEDSATIDELYPMLEGQVAVLSAGVLTASESVTLLNHLFASDMYRPDQHSFMLYPDRDLIGFMEKNVIDADRANSSALIQAMLAQQDTRIVNADIHGTLHFNAEFDNAETLQAKINQLRCDYVGFGDSEWQELFDIYEITFNHKAFTGRSGTMFGYEGLGCIYWHMVSKLLLAVQENYQQSLSNSGLSPETLELNKLYYQVRDGIGFNKTPQQYGAFPTDPYSHTSKQAGAQQPGMTGQVKEEIITRFSELGLNVKQSQLTINPRQLRVEDFLSQAHRYRYISVDGTSSFIDLAAHSLAFTYCQVPFVYQLSEQTQTLSATIDLVNGTSYPLQDGNFGTEMTNALISRSGEIAVVNVIIPTSSLIG